VESAEHVRDSAREQLLDAAEEVFNARGIQAVGMDRLRTAANLPLRRIYQLYPSKDELVVAFLRRRHLRMMSEIAEFVAGYDGDARVSAIFVWLHRWFCEPNFRGCPWMNTFGELGPTQPGVAAEVHRHQREFRKLVIQIVTGAGHSREAASAIYLLVEGAVAVAAVQRVASPAVDARRAAESLISTPLRRGRAGEAAG
jgi:AcrR family transcriptional regulator